MGADVDDEPQPAGDMADPTDSDGGNASDAATDDEVDDETDDDASADPEVGPDADPEGDPESDGESGSAADSDPNEAAEAETVDPRHDETESGAPALSRLLRLDPKGGGSTRLPAPLPAQVPAWLPIWLLGGLTALAVLAAGTSPTGWWFTDVIVAVPSVTLAIWAGRWAPWWWLVAAGLIPLGLIVVGTGGPVAVMFGLLTVALALAQLDGTERGWMPPLAAASLTVAMASLGNLGGFGVSTLVGCGVLAATIALGLRGRSDDAALVRRVLLVVGANAVAAIVVAALFGWWARSDLLAARQALDASVQQASDADISAAGESVATANDRFASAGIKLDNPLMWPVRLVPVAAQNVDAASAAASAGGELTGSVSETIDLATGDGDGPGVEIVDGAVDLDALGELADSAGRLSDDLDQLALSADRARSPWLLPQLDDALAAAGRTARRQRPVVKRYAEAAQLLPDFLGADGERHYFVMFTTPAEARGTGGFMGNFAELSVDEGKISLSRFGRVNDLEESMNPQLRLQDAPPDWLARYGSYGFYQGRVGGVAEDAWAVINLSAHFPSTAQVVAEMYDASEGPKVDGVFSIDVYGLEALVDLVGPIEVDDGTTLTGDNTAEFLLLDQYLIGDGRSNAPRVDMLATIADEVLNRLLNDKPPSAAGLATNLGRPARERRLLAWSRHDAEEGFFADIGVSGAVLDPHERKPTSRKRGADDPEDADELRPAFQVVLNNGTGSKIDSFLKRTITVEGTSVTVELTNDAPSSGLPDYVIGTANDLDIPLGTNITNVTIYSTSPLSDFTLDGKPVTPPTGTEAGYDLYDMRFAIPPGDTTTITFETAEPDNLNIYQPLARTVDE